MTEVRRGIRCADAAAGTGADRLDQVAGMDAVIEDRSNPLAPGAIAAAMETARVKWMSEPMQQEMLKVLRPASISPDILHKFVAAAFAAGYGDGTIDALTLVNEATKRCRS